MTAQLDHVVIDRFGVLIIESKVRRGAVIKGSDVQKQWTACYPGRRNVPFQNPLAQNREHENAVRQALKQSGNALNPDFVKSAVVFAEADLTQLELDSLARVRVVDVGALEELVRARHDFAVNNGDLSESEVASLAGLLRGLDRSGDPAVLKQHVEHRRGGRSQATTLRPQGRSAATKSDRGSARGNGFLDRLRRALTELILRLLLVVVALGLLWWFLTGPVPGWLVSKALPGNPESHEQPTSTTAPASDVPAAMAALQEIDPAIYAALVYPDTPTITSSPSGTTYTWEYVVTQGDSAQVKTIALTLDGSGQVVGADIR
jgi:hypothetical protein